jgi:DNA-binding MarR family transcriptional regulator
MRSVDTEHGHPVRRGRKLVRIRVLDPAGDLSGKRPHHGAQSHRPARILGLVAEAGTMAAGALAAAAALSPAATTTAIQRLVSAGHLSRGVDDRDRRRAVVALTPPARDLLHAVYAPIGRAGRRELARYSAEDLTVILDFLRRGIRLQLAQAERIRAMTAQHAGPRSARTARAVTGGAR